MGFLIYIFGYLITVFVMMFDFNDNVSFFEDEEEWRKEYFNEVLGLSLFLCLAWPVALFLLLLRRIYLSLSKFIWNMLKARFDKR